MWINDDGMPMEKKYEHEESDPLYPIYCYVDEDLSGTAEKGKAELSSIVGNKHGFDTVKPVQLMKYLIQTFTNKNDLIVDLFAGSCTTAQACFEQNDEDAGNRKCISIQYPEICDSEGEAFSAGFKTICDIGTTRMKKLQAKYSFSSDIGYRYFKVDDSNMKDVYYSASDYKQGNLDMFESNIKEDRNDLDLLFDCMLRWGVELSLPLESTKVDGCTIHNVNDGDLVGCFEGVVSEKVIDAIAAMNPVRVVFRDSSFTEAANKMNLFELFKQKCSWTDEEVKKNVRVI